MLLYIVPVFMSSLEVCTEPVAAATSTRVLLSDEEPI